MLDANPNAMTLPLPELLPTTHRHAQWVNPDRWADYLIDRDEMLGRSSCGGRVMTIGLRARGVQLCEAVRS